MKFLSFFSLCGLALGASFSENTEGSQSEKLAAIPTDGLFPDIDIVHGRIAAALHLDQEEEPMRNMHNRYICALQLGLSSTGYPVSIMSPHMVDSAVKNLMDDPSKTDEDKKADFSILATSLAREKNTRALARLLEIVPGDLFSVHAHYDVSPRTFYELAAVSQDLALKLLKLNPSSLSLDMLSSLLLAEIPFEGLKSFFDPDLHCDEYSNGTPVRAVIQLCTSSFPVPSAEKRVRILQQNERLIAWTESMVGRYQECSNLQSQLSVSTPLGIQDGPSDIDFDIPYARLLNRMRFSDVSDEKVKMEASLFLNCDSPSRNIKASGILLAIMHMRNLVLFMEVYTYRRCPITLSLLKAFRNYPEFSQTISRNESMHLMEQVRRFFFTGSVNECDE